MLDADVAEGGGSVKFVKVNEDLPNSVFLDGDWCWDASPFQVTDETKAMVTNNICYLLNNFLKCSAYENIIFCWVMHEQSIIDSILEKLDTQNCDVKCVSSMESIILCSCITQQKMIFSYAEHFRKLLSK